MSLMVRVSMFPEKDGLIIPFFVFDIHPVPEVPLDLDGVSLPLPSFRLVWVPLSLPLDKLPERRVFTHTESLCAYPSFVVVRPPPNDRVEGSYDTFLGSRDPFSQETFDLMSMLFDGYFARRNARLIS